MTTFVRSMSTPPASMPSVLTAEVVAPISSVSHLAPASSSLRSRLSCESLHSGREYSRLFWSSPFAMSPISRSDRVFFAFQCKLLFFLQFG